ncbi:MAG TPA: ATP-binding protein [Pyrinomonadaceae bacterium]|nr:ATP-binding protein [Pyrinomonadaceae bacterium]
MGIENFIRDALRQPNDLIAYHVGRQLAELYPDKTIIEGSNWYFDLEAFVRAEKCSVIEEKSVFHHVRTDWEGVGKRQKQRIENSWLNVLWSGQLFDVILITWMDGYYRRRYHWIVGDDAQFANSFVAAVCEWSCEVRGEIVVYHDGYFEKDEELFRSIKSATFNNLILRDSLKKEIESDFDQFFSSREIYERYGIPWKRGALFIGPPGNGKTHTIKALINKLGKPCIYVRSFKADCGTEQENMAEVFKRARMTTPCLVVLEDLDSMIDGNNRSFFLNELDGFETNTGVVVLATTNHPKKLDTAIMDRPSRFDRKYHFELPGDNERLAYIRNWNNQLQPELRVSESGAAKVVQTTGGFSFAYLKELFVASMVQWMSVGGNKAMDDIIATQVDMLRNQCKLKKSKKAKANKA